MKIIIKKCFLFFLPVMAFNYGAIAQNIVNDTVYVSTSSIIEIIFNSPIEKAVMPNGDGSYESTVSGNTRSIMINALKKNAKDQPLIVNEGTREHKFILSFKEATPAIRIDWSDLKKLTAHTNNIQQSPSKKNRRELRALSKKQAGDGANVQDTIKKPPAEESEAEKSRKALVNANEWYKKGLWQEAKAAYGLVTDPDMSDFVNFRIEDINKKLQEEEKKKKEEMDKNYKEAMVKAKTLTASGKYTEAYDYLIQALENRPNDADAQARLSLIKKKLTDLDLVNENKKKETQFTNYVARGDEAFKGNQFENAITNYEAALKIRPGNQGLVKKLADTKKAINNESFQDWKRKGDNALQKGDMNGAKTYYEEAVKIKPQDAYVMKQLAQLNNLQNKLEHNEGSTKTDSLKTVEYRRAIFTADHFYDAKNYDFALEEYKRATRIFQDSTYPGNQIKKINQLRANSSKNKSVINRTN